MMSSRQTQPFRRGPARHPSVALLAMMRGKPFFLPNPMDLRRREQLLAAARARRRV